MRKFLYFFIISFALFSANGITFAETTLQHLIDQTQENGVLKLEGKTYEGNIVISSPITIIGTEKTIIKGEGKGNVITVNASNVTLKNLTVTNSGKDLNS